MPMAVDAVSASIVTSQQKPRQPIEMMWMWIDTQQQMWLEKLQ